MRNKLNNRRLFSHGIKVIVILLLLGMAYTGCLETNEKMPISMAVSLDSTDDFPSTGGTKTLKISSNTNRWEVSSDAAWLSFSPQSTGQENGSVTVRAQENKSSSSLTANITISGTGFTTQTQKVSIARAELNLDVSVSSLAFEASNESKTFTVASNTNWNVSNNLPDWLTVSPMSGQEGSTTLTATVAVNTGTSQRTATISLSGGGLNHAISVIQAEARIEPELEVSVSSLTFGASDESKTFTVTSNTNWNVSNNLPDWLTVSPMSGQEGTMTLTATVSGNATPSQRTATVSVSGGGLNHEISVIQADDKSILYSWDLTNTMKATLNEKGVLTISTTANAEAMPDDGWPVDRLWHSVTNSILSVVIENKVTTIGYGAFWGCSNLTSVTIPNSVIYIEASAFRECTKLSFVSIPASVSEIQSTAFVVCDNLTSINVDVGNAAYSSDAGILYNKNKTLLFRYPPGKSNVSFIIPNTVNIIGDDAFQGCNNLTSVTIPDPVKSIGDESFAGCKNLTSVIISSSVTSISDYAFSSSTNLKDVTVSWPTPLSIGGGVFWDLNLSAATLHVPAGTKSLYQAHPVWGSFGNITEEGSPNDPLFHEMVSVQGGVFTMGCTSEQGSDCENSEHPAHQVTLSDFQIGKFEVTQAQWVTVMGTTLRQQRDLADPSGVICGEGDHYPMYYVSWNDIVGTSGATMVINSITYYANGFIYKLNQLTGKQYRLPTEAEWEYAARGGRSEGFKYSGSNTVGDVAWYINNSSGNTRPVGAKIPNELGLHDMSGNVYEWCSDRWGSYTGNAQTNPQGPSTGSVRVFRGGGWGDAARNMRVSYRFAYRPEDRYNYIGFRLALTDN